MKRRKGKKKTIKLKVKKKKKKTRDCKCPTLKLAWCASTTLMKILSDGKSRNRIHSKFIQTPTNSRKVQKNLRYTETLGLGIEDNFSVGFKHTHSGNTQRPFFDSNETTLGYIYVQICIYTGKVAL